MPGSVVERYITPRMSRRAFFPALLHELRIFAEASRGKPTFGLDELAHMGDEELAAFVPLLNAAFELSLEQGVLRCRERASGRLAETLELASEEMVALALFDGKHSLGAIGRQVANETGLDPARGFACARSLFLALAARLICVPANAPGQG